MTTITVHVPDELEAFVAAQVVTSGCVSAGEYILSLIRQTQQSRDRAALEARLLVGVESLDRGEGKPMTAADWDRLRAGIGTTSEAEHQGRVVFPP